jgi:rhodanese-related sulfurtransferase
LSSVHAPKSIADVLAEARSKIRRLPPLEAQRAVTGGALLVDIRPAGQRRREGGIPGALIIERNLLEWRLDPSSDTVIPEVKGHEQQIIIFCSEGYTSSLAAAALKELGFESAADLGGGFLAWKSAGLPTTTGA